MEDVQSSRVIINLLIEFSEKLLRSEYSKRLALSDPTLDPLIKNLNALADHMQLSNLSHPSVELTINSFIEVISSYANRDFSKKLNISNESSVLDAIATGINILGEELEHSTVSKSELQREHEQLRIAKEQAELASRAKTVFLGNLSHEIRTPLQGIIGFAEILPKIPNKEKQLQYASIIIKRANDLLGIIEDLLDISVIESGKIEAHPESFSLQEALNKIFNEFTEDSRLKSDNKLDLIITSSLHTEEKIYIDPLHFRQVIRNLLDNAVKFTPNGSVHIDSSKQESYYMVKVTDTGIGIPKDALDMIFEPFRQAHEGYSRRKSGIGLGLPICKKRVELWNGKLSVTSEPNIGSTFFFTIPVS